AAHRDFRSMTEECGLDRSVLADPDASLRARAALPASAVLVILCLTEVGSVGYVIPAGTRNLGEKHLLKLDHFTLDAFTSLAQKGSKDGWIDRYQEFRAELADNGGRATAESLTKWNLKITEILEISWANIMERVDQKLKSPEIDVAPGSNVYLAV